MGLAQELWKTGACLLTGCWNKHFTNGMSLKPGMILATDSAKRAHYLKAVYPGIGLWFGNMKKCIDAAVCGKWMC